MRGVFRLLMKSHRRIPWTCALVAALAAALRSAAAADDTVRNHFDSDSIMRAPGFFDLVVLGADGGTRWLVLTDPNPPSAPNRLVQTEPKRPDDSIAAALRRTYTFQDGTTTCMIKRGGTGRAGILVRVADEKNYVMLSVDTATADLVLTSTVNGKATE